MSTLKTPIAPSASPKNSKQDGGAKIPAAKPTKAKSGALPVAAADTAKTITHPKSSSRGFAFPKPPADEAAALARFKLKARFDATPVNELWAQYAKARTEELRNYFWERYFPLVRFISERTSTRLPDEVDVNDLMSAGQFGLMEAVNAFDLSYGVKFETYCAQRIKGAILDELRNMDWVPRLVRHRSSKVETARQRFEMREGRIPTQDELAAILGVDGEEFDKIEKDSKAVGTVSLARKCFSSDGTKDVTEIDVIKDGSQSNPLIETQRRDMKDLITKGLSRAERLIVILYYYEEMTMKEIGSTLDLSESRVSQMHSSILLRLKAQMQHRAKDLDDQD
ncbi:hypothetical protein BH11PLA1_BH11PLA1_09920 [soil metagenome]